MKPAGEINDGTAELGRLFEEALRCLASTDLDGANAALEKAHAEAALSRGDAETPGFVGVDDGVADAPAPVGPPNGKLDRG